MKNYNKILEDKYQEAKSYIEDLENKDQFLGSFIFDFTTYDDEKDEYFALQMIDVINAIINNTTFKYIQNEDYYLNYLTMVNMPFLKNKLDWGGSIRGAWLDDYKEYDIAGIKIEKEELTNFLTQLIEWRKI